MLKTRVAVIRRNHRGGTRGRGDGEEAVVNFPVTSDCRLLPLQICSCVKCTKRDRPIISPVVSVFTPPSFVLWKNGRTKKIAVGSRVTRKFHSRPLDRSSVERRERLSSPANPDSSVFERETQLSRLQNNFCDKRINRGGSEIYFPAGRISGHYFFVSRTRASERLFASDILRFDRPHRDGEFKCFLPIAFVPKITKKPRTHLASRTDARDFSH